MQKFRIAFLTGLAALLAACGPSSPDRGALISPASTVTTLSKATIDGATTTSGLIALSGAAACDVKVVSLNYQTVGAQGEYETVGGAVNATGVLLLPTNCAQASSPLPLLAYARGTEVNKARAMANPADGETFLLAAMYAAQGYAVVATDYLGFNGSIYSYHPYLHADSEASTVIDSVRAARRAVASVGGATLSGKVVFAGYSQGGHASMSAHRAAERDNASEFDVAAGAHLAGPYNLSGSFRGADLNNPIAGYQYFVPFIVTAWNRVYGNLYTSATISTIFNSPYSGWIDTLLPSPTLTYTTLITNSKLPGGTPKQAQDALFNLSYLTDVTTNLNNPLYLNAKKNDLLGWSPRAQTLLCGGAGDPTVSPAVHQSVMKADFDSRSLTNVSSVDVDTTIRALYYPGTGAYPAADLPTYYGSYHGGYEPPLCHKAAKTFFDTVLGRNPA